MWRLKNLKKHRLKLVLLSLGLLVWSILGPVTSWLWPGNWWGTSLVVLMNENEARPCGGFVTAYAVAKLPFGGVELHNSFAFPPVNLGQNAAPLRAVALERKFWDLGDTLDQSDCAAQFAEAYQRALGEEATRVVLLQAGLVEAWLRALGGFKAGEYALDEHNFFATTSRLVADVDRHDEAALAERKTPLNRFGKQLITRTLVRVWRWPLVSRVLGRAQQEGLIYFHKVTRPRPAEWVEQQDRLITVSEWNLGGGKSSRYLDKSWQVWLRQTAPDLWAAEIRLTAQHLGGYDEPLSQTWKGGFELTVLQGSPVFIPAEIAPGETFTHTETVIIGGHGLRPKLTEPYQLWLYAPAYQRWRSALQISALAQQSLVPQAQYLSIQENTGTWEGVLHPAAQKFTWQLKPDTQPPFLTWHKPLSPRALEARTRLDLQHGSKDIIVEVHFNEPVELLDRIEKPSGSQNRVYQGANLEVRLLDRDYEVRNITEDPVIKTAVLYPDGRTLLLNVEQNQFQKNERFYLEIDNVADQWGNHANLKGRTVITR